MKTFLKEVLIWHLQEGFFVIHQKGLYPCPKKVPHKSPMNSMKETPKNCYELLEIGAELWLEGVQVEGVSLSIFGSPICKNMDEVRYYTNFSEYQSRAASFLTHPTHKHHVELVGLWTIGDVCVVPQIFMSWMLLLFHQM